MSGNGDNVKEENRGEAFNISIKAQDGTEMQFKIKRTTKLHKVFAAYAQKKSVDPSQFRFLFDGNRLKDSLTAEEAGLEDGDSIDALVEQIGG